MLPPAEWEAEARALEVGHRRRIAHLCGPGTPLLVSRDRHSYRAFCFRCDDTGWLPGERETMAEMLARVQRERAADAQVQSAELPPLELDPTQWPELARVWLYKAGMGNYEIREFGAGYHAETGRVFLPLPGFWIARSVDGRMPKYLGPPVGRRACVPEYGPEDAPVVAITEDVLSAWKIGRSGAARAVAALGVTLSDAALARIIDVSRVLVWLDPDAAGQAGAAKLRRELRSVGVNAVNVTSRADPKLLQLDEIRSTIWNHCNGH